MSLLLDNHLVPILATTHLKVGHNSLYPIVVKDKYFGTRVTRCEGVFGGLGMLTWNTCPLEIFPCTDPKPGCLLLLILSPWLPLLRCGDYRVSKYCLVFINLIL